MHCLAGVFLGLYAHSSSREGHLTSVLKPQFGDRAVPGSSHLWCFGLHLSPSMLLKSLTMAIPRPAMEYRTVSTITSSVKVPNRACSFSILRCKALLLYSRHTSEAQENSKRFYKLWLLRGNASLGYSMAPSIPTLVYRCCTYPLQQGMQQMQTPDGPGCLQCLEAGRAVSCLSGPPRQRDVRRAECIVACPAALFKLEGWRRVDVGDERPEDCQHEQCGELVAGQSAVVGMEWSQYCICPCWL